MTLHARWTRSSYTFQVAMQLNLSSSRFGRLAGRQKNAPNQSRAIWLHPLPRFAFWKAFHGFAGVWLWSNKTRSFSRSNQSRFGSVEVPPATLVEDDDSDVVLRTWSPPDPPLGSSRSCCPSSSSSVSFSLGVNVLDSFTSLNVRLPSKVAVPSRPGMLNVILNAPFSSDLLELELCWSVDDFLPSHDEGGPSDVGALAILVSGPFPPPRTSWRCSVIGNVWG